MDFFKFQCSIHFLAYQFKITNLYRTTITSANKRLAIYIGTSLMFAGLIDVKDYSKNHTESRKEHLGKVLVGVLSVTVMSIHVQKMVTL